MIYDCLNFNEEDAKERNDDLQGEIVAVFCCQKKITKPKKKDFNFKYWYIQTFSNFLINSKVFHFKII